MRVLGTSAVLLTVVLVAGGCSNSSDSAPDVATSATAVPGSVPQLGEGTVGALSISEIALQRSGSQLTLSGRIVNAGPADELTRIASQVTEPLTPSPAITLPAKASTELGKDPSIILTENARLEPGGTVDLTLTFGQAGSVQVFASFSDS